MQDVLIIPLLLLPPRSQSAKPQINVRKVLNIFLIGSGLSAHTAQHTALSLRVATLPAKALVSVRAQISDVPSCPYGDELGCFAFIQHGVWSLSVYGTTHRIARTPRLWFCYYV